MTPYRRALLEALTAELASRAPTDKSALFDPVALCHEGQREAVAARDPTASWVTTRRAGKTTGAVLLMFATALATADVNVLYLSTTITRAVRTIWDELVKANREHGLGGVPNASNHFIRLPNGSKIWVSGCETKTEADAWRGVLPRTALVFVDEGQDWKDDLLDYTYGSVIMPSLADVGGRFILAGTPGSPRGFFFEFHKTAPCYRWSLFDNPHVKDARRMLAETMRVRGCDETDPSIRREFFGEFALDLQRRIFPYDDAKNGFDELPPGEYDAILGFDFGTVDACAGVAWKFREGDPYRYVVEADSQSGLGGGGQAAFAQSMCDRYPEAISIVGDPGGGGKGVITDVRQDHGIPMDAAKKTDKAAACIILRDGLRSGVVKVDRKLKKFIDSLGIPEWDPDRVGEVVKGHMPDEMDAGLYGYREVVGRHLYIEPPAPKTRQEIEEDETLERQEREESLIRDMGLA